MLYGVRLQYNDEKVFGPLNPLYTQMYVRKYTYLHTHAQAHIFAFLYLCKFSLWIFFFVCRQRSLVKDVTYHYANTLAPLFFFKYSPLKIWGPSEYSVALTSVRTINQNITVVCFMGMSIKDTIQPYSISSLPVL